MPSNTIDKSSTGVHRSGRVPCGVDDVRTQSGPGRIQPPAHDVGDRAGHRDAVDLGCHRHRIRRDPVNEVHRAIDRIQHPGDGARGGVRRIGGSADLFAENGVAGAQLRQLITQQPFGLGVHNGHRVGRGRLRADRSIAPAACSGAEHLAATAPDERGRFPGQRFGHRTQMCRFVLRCAHRTIASQVRLCHPAGGFGERPRNGPANC